MQPLQATDSAREYDPRCVALSIGSTSRLHMNNGQADRLCGSSNANGRQVFGREQRSRHEPPASSQGGWRNRAPHADTSRGAPDGLSARRYHDAPPSSTECSKSGGEGQNNGRLQSLTSSRSPINSQAEENLNGSRRTHFGLSERDPIRDIAEEMPISDGYGHGSCPPLASEQVDSSLEEDIFSTAHDWLATQESPAAARSDTDMRQQYQGNRADEREIIHAADSLSTTDSFHTVPDGHRSESNEHRPSLKQTREVDASHRLVVGFPPRVTGSIASASGLTHSALPSRSQTHHYAQRPGTCQGAASRRHTDASAASVGQCDRGTPVLSRNLPDRACASSGATHGSGNARQTARAVQPGDTTTATTAKGRTETATPSAATSADVPSHSAYRPSKSTDMRTLPLPASGHQHGLGSSGAVSADTLVTGMLEYNGVSAMARQRSRAHSPCSPREAEQVALDGGPSAGSASTCRVRSAAVPEGTGDQRDGNRQSHESGQTARPEVPRPVPRPRRLGRDLGKASANSSEVVRSPDGTFVPVISEPAPRSGTVHSSAHERQQRLDNRSSPPPELSNGRHWRDPSHTGSPRRHSMDRVDVAPHHQQHHHEPHHPGYPEHQVHRPYQHQEPHHQPSPQQQPHTPHQKRITPSVPRGHHQNPPQTRQQQQAHHASHESERQKQQSAPLLQQHPCAHVQERDRSPPHNAQSAQRKPSDTRGGSQQQQQQQ
eukprot:scpid45577/ scgid3996/ 